MDPKKMTHQEKLLKCQTGDENNQITSHDPLHVLIWLITRSLAKKN